MNQKTVSKAETGEIVEPGKFGKRKKKHNKISIRAQKYIQNKVEGLSDYQAAIKAGYSPATAKAAAHNIEKPSVKASLAQLLDKAGLTDDRISELIAKRANNSKRSIVSDGRIQKVEDNPTMYKYIELAVKVKDHMPKDKPIEINLQQPSQVILNVERPE